MKMLRGSVQETQFEWPKETESMDEMKILQETLLHNNEVTYINDTVGLHRVENPSHSQVAVSLHLYSPPFKTCQTFDQRTGHANEVKVTFHSAFAKRTPFQAEGSAAVQLI